MGKRAKFNLFRIWLHVAYQIKGNGACSNIVVNTLPIDPLSRPWGVGKKVKIHFSDYGHVAYQIKGNDKCSNMQAHILSFHIPSTLGWGKMSKLFFLKAVMLHIKLKEWKIEHHASTYSKLTYTLDPWGGVKGQNILFRK